MVFQSCALSPHMSVRNNIAVPLNMAGMAADETGKRVLKAAETLNLADDLDRKPGDAVALRPREQRIHRFDAAGKVIRA